MRIHDLVEQSYFIYLFTLFCNKINDRITVDNYLPVLSCVLKKLLLNCVVNFNFVYRKSGLRVLIFFL